MGCDVRVTSSSSNNGVALHDCRSTPLAAIIDGLLPHKYHAGTFGELLNRQLDEVLS